MISKKTLTWRERSNITISLSIHYYWKLHWMAPDSFGSCLWHCLEFIRGRYFIKKKTSLYFKGNLEPLATYPTTWVP